jgi:hypothetical protein
VNDRDDAARSLYLELRAGGLELWVEDDPERGPLDYGIEFAGIHKIPGARAEEVRERIRLNEEGLVRVLLDHRDPDIRAIRAEGNNRY